MIDDEVHVCDPRHWADRDGADFPRYSVSEHSTALKNGSCHDHNFDVLALNNLYRYICLNTVSRKTDLFRSGVRFYTPQIARFMGPTCGPPGSFRPQMGPIVAQ